MTDPARYEAWYHSGRGAWIGDAEFAVMMALLRPRPGATLLDVGSGTGYFSRRFVAAGLRVTGVDPNTEAVRYARALGSAEGHAAGTALALPFVDEAFDYSAAVTSLCFVDDPARALAEMWRVSRKGVVLGLLNYRSLLYRRKRGIGGYQGARWDTQQEIDRWIESLAPRPLALQRGSAVFLPGGGWPARLLERVLPSRLPWGGFLAVCLYKTL